MRLSSVWYTGDCNAKPRLSPSHIFFFSFWNELFPVLIKLSVRGHAITFGYFSTLRRKEL